jgi:hypothetical protein
MPGEKNSAERASCAAGLKRRTDYGMRANTRRILPATTTNAESREKKMAEDSSSSALSAIVHVMFLVQTPQ